MSAFAATHAAKRLEQRARVVRQIRSFFEARDFLEVQTPILVPSPGMDLHLEAFRVEDAEPPRYLITSPEYQMKRLLACGYPRIFQVTTCFRRGEFGQQHNPEFSMLEWYRGPGSMDDVIADTEQLVSDVTKQRVTLGERTVDTRPPFRRITVGEAFASYAGIDDATDLAENDEDRFFRVLVENVEPRLAELDHAIFLTDYPAVFASLARRRPNAPRIAERFELYVAGIEVCNGFGELTDPVEQRQRFLHDQAERRKRGLAVYPIDERFIEALERGIPNSGGNALGVDRLVALACGTTSIRDVIAFAADEL